MAFHGNGGFKSSLLPKGQEGLTSAYFPFRKAFDWARRGQLGLWITSRQWHLPICVYSSFIPINYLEAAWDTQARRQIFNACLAMLNELTSNFANSAAQPSHVTLAKMRCQLRRRYWTFVMHFDSSVTPPPRKKVEACHHTSTERGATNGDMETSQNNPGVMGCLCSELSEPEQDW